MPYLFKTLDGITTHVSHVKNPSVPVVPTPFDNVIRLVTSGGKSYRYKRGPQRKNITLRWTRSYAITHEHFLDIQNWYETEVDGKLNSFLFETPVGTTYPVECIDDTLRFDEISPGSGYYFGEINLMTIIE